MMDILFYLGVALLFTHELDAIHRHEWRMFPLIGRLRENAAYITFTVLHIPLFMLPLWLLDHPSTGVRFWSQVSMDGFFMVHSGLHVLLRNHDQNQFNTVFSRTIIVANALVGLLHLVLLVG